MGTGLVDWPDFSYSTGENFTINPKDIRRAKENAVY